VGTPETCGALVDTHTGPVCVGLALVAFSRLERVPCDRESSHYAHSTQLPRSVAYLTCHGPIPQHGGRDTAGHEWRHARAVVIIAHSATITDPRHGAARHADLKSDRRLAHHVATRARGHTMARGQQFWLASERFETFRYSAGVGREPRTCHRTCNPLKMPRCRQSWRRRTCRCTRPPPEHTSDEAGHRASQQHGHPQRVWHQHGSPPSVLPQTRCLRACCLRRGASERAASDEVPPSVLPQTGVSDEPVCLR